MHESPGFRTANVDVARSILPPVHIFPPRQEHVVVSGCFALSNNEPPKARLRFGVNG
jgi:hypothetical protein